MDVVAKIMRGVSDVKPLSEHPDVSAVIDLFHAYTRKAQHNDNLPVVTLESTGAELKDAVAELEAEDLVEVLYNFFLIASGRPPVAVYEDPRVTEARKLKHWLVKAAFLVFAPIPPLLVGAAIAIGVKSGVMPDNSVIQGIMSTAGEILKLIFSLPG